MPKVKFILHKLFRTVFRTKIASKSKKLDAFLSVMIVTVMIVLIWL